MNAAQRRVAIAAVFFATAFAGAASASEFCMLKQTSDGFVALRDGPGPNFRRVAKMAAGDEVMPSPLAGDSKGKWQKVKWWRGQERLTRGFEKPNGQGWVHRDLMEDCG